MPAVCSFNVHHGFLVWVCVCIRGLVTGSSPIVNEVWTPDFSRPRPPPPPPLHQPRCQSPHWGDTYHWSGKELLCNNTHTHKDTQTLRYQRMTPVGKCLSFSADIKVYRLSSLDEDDRMTAFPWQRRTLATVRAALVPTVSTLSIKLPIERFWPHHCSVIYIICLTSGLSMSSQIQTHSQIYLRLPAWCLFLGRVSCSVLPPPFLWR